MHIMVQRLCEGSLGYAPSYQPSIRSAANPSSVSGISLVCMEVTLVTRTMPTMESAFPPTSIAPLNISVV